MLKARFWFCAVLCFLSALIRAQSTNISGTINQYAAVTAVAAQSVNVSSAAGFAAGDRVLIIQMKGATINTSNNVSYGSILNYNDAGNYEFATISSVAGTTVNFAAPLIRTYTASDYVQLVRVPTYVNVVVTGLLTCTPWNGITGGVLAFEASGTVTLSANIDVSGKGFLGGVLSNGAFSSCAGDTFDYVLPSSTIASGRKGEGIVDPNPAATNGKGAYANGGGGGNDCNGGGAGGGNYGLGGHGGDPKVNVSCPPFYYQQAGGQPGKNLTYSNAVNKVFMGGAGGAGHQNNAAGSAGVSGGGIVIIRGSSLAGNNNTINANGTDNTIIAGIDGQGGGGAGGSVLLDVCSITALNVSVNGGKGGEDNFNGSDCHGKGGGGGGGIIWVSNSLSGVTASLAGGLPGVFTNSASLCYNTSSGATQGQPGGTLTGLVIPGTTATGNVTGTKIDTTLCTNNPVQLNAPAASSYTWSTGSNSQSINVNASGVYWVQFYQSCSVVIDTFDVHLTIPPVVNVLRDTSFCSGQPYVLDASAAGASAYMWNNGSHTSSVSVNASGTYWVDMTIGPCTVRDSAVIVIYNTPALTVTNYTVCNGQSAVLTPTVTGGTAPYTYNWGTGNTGPTYTISPGASTNYSVQVSDVNGCSAPVATGSITVLSPLSVNVNGAGVCTGDSVHLVASASGGNGNYTYSWSPTGFTGNPLDMLAPAGTTVYTVTVSDGCTLNSASDTALVQVTLAPVITLPPPVSGCAPVCIDLSSVSYTGLSTWQWNYGNGTLSNSQNGMYCYDKTGSYNISFSYTTALGCVKTVSTHSIVTVFPQPVAAFTPSATEADIINAEIYFLNQSQGYTGSQWTFGDLAVSSVQNPYHTYAAPGTYPVMLVVKNNYGCYDTVIHEITIYDVFTFYAPTAFSPNYDEDNDVFLPMGTGWDDKSFSLVIYDRWGNLVVSTTDPYKGWNGFLKGKEAQEDVYVWKVELRDVQGAEHQYSGTISLIR